ncbi:MAG: hypothetical protein WBA12_10450 [Catalinimonas sp.]
MSPAPRSDPDYLIDEHIVSVQTADALGLLTIQFFVEYPPSAQGNVTFFEQRYNIIDLNDTYTPGVLYDYPLLRTQQREINTRGALSRRGKRLRRGHVGHQRRGGGCPALGRARKQRR